MEKHFISFEVKQVQTEEDFYKIEGIASTTDVDLGNDIVQANAIVESAERLGFPSFRFQHDPKAGPIGVFDEIKQDGQKTLIVARLPKRDEDGNLLERMAEIAGLAKMKAFKGLSIGFNVVKDSFKDSVRILEKIDVVEISLVDFPMNQNAVLTGVKSADVINLIEKAEKLSDIEDILKGLGCSKKEAKAMISKIKMECRSDSDDSKSVADDVDLSDLVEAAKKLVISMEK